MFTTIDKVRGAGAAGYMCIWSSHLPHVLPADEDPRTYRPALCAPLMGLMELRVNSFCCQLSRRRHQASPSTRSMGHTCVGVHLAMQAMQTSGTTLIASLAPASLRHRLQPSVPADCSDTQSRLLLGNVSYPLPCAALPLLPTPPPLCPPTVPAPLQGRCQEGGHLRPLCRCPHVCHGRQRGQV